MGAVTKGWDSVSQIQSAGRATTCFAVTVCTKNTFADDHFPSHRDLSIDKAVRDELAVFATVRAVGFVAFQFPGEAIQGIEGVNVAFHGGIVQQAPAHS